MSDARTSKELVQRLMTAKSLTSHDADSDLMLEAAEEIDRLQRHIALRDSIIKAHEARAAHEPCASEPDAWMAEDGRVITKSAHAFGERQGGAPEYAIREFTIPLYRTVLPPKVPMGLRECCQDFEHCQERCITMLNALRGRIKNAAKPAIRLRMTGAHVKELVDMLDLSGTPEALETPICLQHYDEDRVCEDEGDAMPAGLYAWFEEYPEEGQTLIEPRVTSTKEVSR